jgi:glycosyltransferase involved in cell wall biosynthesis
MRVAYLLASFPITSEIFILNEIDEAIRQGVDIRIFSQMIPLKPCPHARVSYLKSRIEYLPSIDSVDFKKTLNLHMKLMLMNPGNYLKTFLYAIRHRDDAMLWAFKVFVHYAWSVRRFRPDMLHTHFAYGNSRFTMLTSKLLGIPYTFTIHGWYDLYKAPPSFLREVILNSKKTLTVCNYNREYIISHYRVPDTKVEVIRCGIPVENFNPDGRQKNEDLIISVGRLHYHKAYHVLVQACKILSEKDVRFQCWIIGDGELKDNIQKMITELNLDNKVFLLGEKSNEEVQALLPKARVFALTSEVEVVGLANAEAMASGLPVVATSVFGVPELVEDGVTGYLCPPNEPESIAARLEYLLRNEDICREMGSKGRSKVIEMHNLERQVRKLVSNWE